MSEQFTTAAEAYQAIHDMSQAMAGINMPEFGSGDWPRLQAAERAARAWLAEHPDEARAYRVRDCMSKLHYSLQEIASETDRGRRITLAMMLQEAADSFAGEARAWEQAERDRADDERRQQRLEQEHAARLLPRRAEDIAARISA